MKENPPPMKIKPADVKVDVKADAEIRHGKVVDHPSAQHALTARRARPRRRHWIAAASFVALVAAPTLAAVAYLYLKAADQYASHTAFSIRSGEMAPPTGLIGALAGSLSTGGADGEIVYEFVRSQKMVEAALAALPLPEMFNRADGDFVFRLGEERPIEDIVDYWRWMTDVSFDGASGLVRFEARAFAPDDAHAIATFVLEESTRIVNALSDQARADAIRVGESAVSEAEDRLREVRREIRRFRNVEQDMNPTENARAALALIATLEQNLAQARIDLDAQMTLVGPRSPQIAMMRQQVTSLEKQIDSERARLGAGTTTDAADRTLSGVLSDYEELAVDLEFAQNAYVMALSTLEQAQVEARRQSRFLAPYIVPTLSQEAQYPQRAMLALGVFWVLMVAWAVGLLVVYNVRDRH